MGWLLLTKHNKRAINLMVGFALSLSSFFCRLHSPLLLSISLHFIERIKGELVRDRLFLRFARMHIPSGSSLASGSHHLPPGLSMSTPEGLFLNSSSSESLADQHASEKKVFHMDLLKKLLEKMKPAAKRTVPLTDVQVYTEACILFKVYAFSCVHRGWTRLQG